MSCAKDVWLNTLFQQRYTRYAVQIKQELPIVEGTSERLHVLLIRVVSLIVNFQSPSPDIVGLDQSGSTPNVSFSSVLRSPISAR